MMEEHMIFKLVLLGLIVFGLWTKRKIFIEHIKLQAELVKAAWKGEDKNEHETDGASVQHAPPTSKK